VSDKYPGHPFKTLTSAEDAVRALRVVCERLDGVDFEHQSPEPVDMVLWADAKMQRLQSERDELLIALKRLHKKCGGLWTLNETDDQARAEHEFHAALALAEDAIAEIEKVKV
jgi:hypothetical protein